jgi:monofunctional biosynthetic peptidoglycan transglycosylase
MVYKTIRLFFQISLFLIVVIGFCALLIVDQFPSDQQIRGCVRTKLYAVDLCPGNDSYTPLYQISPYLQKSIIISEDSAFWTHNGFDLQELERSIKTNLQKGKIVRGGSTITQQLVKNMFLSKEKTFSRKVVEAVITMRMEKVLTKKEILERYLNVVQFGKNIFGIKEAAHFYFSKKPSQLTIVESAFLTFLLPSPEIYSKSFFKKELTPFARGRINQIIEKMFQYSRIEEDEYLTARNQLENFMNAQTTKVNEVPVDNDVDFDKVNEEDIIPEDL